MRTTLLVAAVIAALALPIVTYHAPPAPLATAEPAVDEDIDPALEIWALGCRPSVRQVDEYLLLVQLCPNVAL